MLAKHNDVIHSERAGVCAADCDDESPVARVEIHARNHEVVARITVHRVHEIAGIVEASPELTLKARLVPKRRVSRIVEVHDLVTDKNSRRTGYGMLGTVIVIFAFLAFRIPRKGVLWVKGHYVQRGTSSTV